MISNQITIFNQFHPSVLVLDVTLSDGLVSVTKKRFGSPEDGQLFKLHVLNTHLLDKRSPLFSRGVEYDQAEWVIFPYDLVEVLDRLPGGWGYRAKFSLPKFSKPKRSIVD